MDATSKAVGAANDGRADVVSGLRYRRFSVSERCSIALKYRQPLELKMPWGSSKTIRQEVARSPAEKWSL
jgi:hypothetical protein